VTLGTGLLLCQLFPLPRGRFLQRAGGQTLGSSVGHLLHLGKIDIESGSLVAKRMSNDNFSPLLGEPGNSPQFFRRELPCRHDIVILEVREISSGEFPSAYPTLFALSRKVRPAPLWTGRHQLRSPIKNEEVKSKT
jgi:hypothetical protein